MILGLCMEFMLMWGLVAVCAHDCPKFACLRKDFSLLKSLVRGICQLLKYASDFIWMLGKNNLDSLVRLPIMLGASAGTQKSFDNIFVLCYWIFR
jgi:hypothetical protein